MLLLWVTIVSGFLKGTEAILEAKQLKCNDSNSEIVNNAISLKDLCDSPSLVLAENGLDGGEIITQEVKILLSSQGPLLGKNHIEEQTPFVTVANEFELSSDMTGMVPLSSDSLVTFPAACGNYFLVAVLRQESEDETFTSSASAKITRSCRKNPPEGDQEADLQLTVKEESNYDISLDESYKVRSRGITVTLKNVENAELSERTLLDAPDLFACISTHMWDEFWNNNGQSLQEASDTGAAHFYPNFDLLQCERLTGLEDVFFNKETNIGETIPVGREITIDLQKLSLLQVKAGLKCFAVEWTHTLYLHANMNSKIPELNQTNNVLLLPITLNCDSISSLSEQKNDEDCEVLPDSSSDGNDAVILRRNHYLSFKFYGNSRGFSEVDTYNLRKDYSNHLAILEKANRLKNLGLCPHPALDDDVDQYLGLSVVKMAAPLLKKIRTSVAEIQTSGEAAEKDKNTILTTMDLLENITIGFFEASDQFRQFVIQVGKMAMSQWKQKGKMSWNHEGEVDGELDVEMDVDLDGELDGEVGEKLDGTFGGRGDGAFGGRGDGAFGGRGDGTFGGRGDGAFGGRGDETFGGRGDGAFGGRGDGTFGGRGDGAFGGRGDGTFGGRGDGAFGGRGDGTFGGRGDGAFGGRGDGTFGGRGDGQFGGNWDGKFDGNWDRERNFTNNTRGKNQTDDEDRFPPKSNDRERNPALDPTDFWNNFFKNVEGNDNAILTGTSSLDRFLYEKMKMNKNRNKGADRSDSRGQKKQQKGNEMKSVLKKLYYRLSTAQSSDELVEFSFIPSYVLDSLMEFVKKTEAGEINLPNLAFVTTWTEFVLDSNVSAEVFKPLQEKIKMKKMKVKSFLTMNLAVEEMVDLIVYVNTTLAKKLLSHFQENPEAIGLINFSLKLLTVVQSHLKDLLKISKKVMETKMLDKEQWKLLRAQPGKEPSLMMNCYRAAAHFVEATTSGMKKEKMEESPFYDTFTTADSSKLREMPTQWMQYNSGIYRGQRSVILGTMFWDQVAQCSCPDENAGRQFPFDDQYDREYDVNGGFPGVDDFYDDNLPFTEGFGIPAVDDFYDDDDDEDRNSIDDTYKAIHFPVASSGRRRYNTFPRKRTSALVDLSINLDRKPIIRLAFKTKENTYEGGIVYSGIVIVERKSNEPKRRDIGTICDEGWGPEGAELICKQVLERRMKNKYILDGSLAVKGNALLEKKFDMLDSYLPPMMMKNVNCSEGQEDIFKDCSYDGWTKQDCRSYQRAGVMCSFTKQ